MLLSETGFTFGGVHSRDGMGLIYVEKEGHIAIPEIRRNAYQIAGVSGTILMSGAVWQPFNFEGSLYPAVEPASQAEAQTLLRNVAKWLTAGRQQLIFDYEKTRYYMAELSQASKWTLRNWFGGELQIRFLAQPFAYSVTEATKTWTFTSSATQTGEFILLTGLEAPIKVTVTNTGTAAITDVEVSDGISLTGMSVASGQALTIDAEPPVGATINGSSAMRYAKSFELITLGNGSNTVKVRLGFATSGTKKATVVVSARARW